LAEIVSDGLDADGKGKQVSIFGPSPDRSVLIHHLGSARLLVVLENPIVIFGEQPGHNLVDLPPQ